MKAAPLLLGVLIGLTNPSTATAECPLRQQLKDDRRTVDRLVAVSLRDRVFITRFGVKLEKFGIGGTYAPREALFAAFEASGCDPKLEAWIKRKARFPKRQDG